MIGASRTSAAELREATNSRFETSDAAALAADGQAVLEFAGILGRERALRQTMADPAIDSSVKRGTLQSLLSGRVGQSAIELIGRAVVLRWSRDWDLVDALDEAGQNLLLMSAESEGRLDRVEEEIFRFGRAVDASADLQMALTSPATSSASKASLVGQLVADKTDPVTQRLLEYATTQLRGRPIQSAIDELSDRAAARRGRVVAEVRSAIALTDDQERRLAAALGRLHGRAVQLNVHVDPDVIGGLEVRVGDELIDGTLATRLEAARRRMTH